MKLLVTLTWKDGTQNYVQVDAAHPVMLYDDNQVPHHLLEWSEVLAISVVPKP